MHKYGIAALALALIAGTAQAADSPKDIVQRHVSSGGDIDAIMADYADDAVVLQNGRAIAGKPAIRKLYENMFGGGSAPADAAPSASSGDNAASPSDGASGMKIDRIWEEGDVGFLTWQMGPVKATEEFVVRDGKIEVQAIFMQGGPPSS